MTSQPIATISYNTQPFLDNVLSDLIKQHVIQSYMYIQHRGEDGDKDHIHLRIEPNKSIDPMSLTDLLSEFELGKDKPLTVRPWRKSKEEDWILYAIHDSVYLRLKYGEFGAKGEKIPYDYTNIQCPDNFDLDVAYIRAKSYMEHTSPNMIKKLVTGTTALELISQGENPFLVQALNRALYASDYERVVAELNLAKEELRQIKVILNSAGYDIFYNIDDDFYSIDKIGCGVNIKSGNN